MGSISKIESLRQKLAIGTNSRLIWKEWLAYSNSQFRSYPADQIRVVILAQGRTGSTLLESLICSTNNFQRNGELVSQFNSPFKRKLAFPYRYVCGLAKSSDKNFIFHVKPYHLTKEQKIDPLLFLQQLAHDGWKIIHLHRENQVMHVMSGLLAKKRKGYHKFNDKDENLSIHVDINDFTERVNRRNSFYQQEKECLKNLEHIEIVYERDLLDQSSHQETANRIFDFLGLNRQKVNTKLRKINTKSLEDTVINYSEFEQCILDNGWGAFLQD